MRTVAALYIDPRGPYPSVPGVECWDEERDATRYAGPHPVVAHPPCKAWGKERRRWRFLAESRLAVCAVHQVRRWGGVLEHPAYSRLWRECCLPLPGEPQDEHGGVTLAVRQVDWGHVAAKPTWLYVVGATRIPKRPPAREPTHVCSGGKRRGGPGRRLKVCSAQQRRRSPPAFAEWLVQLARTVRMEAG